jgi:hypothetical protein
MVFQLEVSMRKSSAILFVSTLLFFIASSKIVVSAGLLPSHDSSDHCPPRYLSGEALAIHEALAGIGAEPYDPYGFSKLEREAAAQIESWKGPGSPLAIVVLLDELNERGMASLANPPSAICGYDVATFKSLLWLATKILWKRQERASIEPHTFQALADSSIGNIWQEGFEKGLYGLPLDKKIAECWRRGNVTGGQRCMSMRPEIVVVLDRGTAEFEPK